MSLLGVKLPESVCSACGMTLDAAQSTDLDDVRPRPGDVSICFYCGAVSFYGDKLILRKPNAEELVWLDTNDGLPVKTSSEAVKRMIVNDAGT